MNRDKIPYTKVGDYYLPNLVMDEPSYPVNKYGEMHYQWMMEHMKPMAETLSFKCEMNEHLAQISRQADEMMEQLMSRMMKENGVTEELKAQNQMMWLNKYTEIQNEAEKIVLDQIVYRF